MIPLQVIDSFLLNYDVGQVLLLVFVLGVLGTLPLKSRKVLGLHTTAFGLLFLLTPQAVTVKVYLFLGIALIVVGPLLWTTAKK